MLGPHDTCSFLISFLFTSVVLTFSFQIQSVFGQQDETVLSISSSLAAVGTAPTGQHGLLDVIEIDLPVHVPPNADDCSMVLMRHSFGSSYGQPFVGSL